MAEIIRMPKMSDTMTEGVLAKWHKKVGDEIKSGDLVAEIETDKATMEFESFQDGVLLYLGVDEGKSIPVDGIMAILGEKGEDYKTLLKEALAKEKVTAAAVDTKTAAPAKKTAKPASAPAASVVKTPSPVNTSVQTTGNSRIKVSPLAKKLASDKGIDISRIMGSGDGGRIVKRDVEWFRQDAVAGTQQLIPGAVTEEGFDEIEVSQMRKTIARRLAESKFSAPHFYLTMEINMDRCIDARNSIKAVSDAKISFNDFIVKATAAALRQHPKVNSSWLEDRIRYNHHIHIGIAVGVDEGLLVPVVRFTDSKTLTQISNEVRDYAARAKNKKLQPADWEGNTFTISNLGMFGIDEFTAIINPPDACILAVGSIKQSPVIKDGQLQNTNTMKVTLSCDHRVVDGVTGSQFLQTLKGFLENPVVMLGQASI
jgi:pyruvate dehydrogenase E2 component (dihydrolipoyllysine-residue acetyltransferase)